VADHGAGRVARGDVAVVRTGQLGPERDGLPGIVLGEQQVFEFDAAIDVVHRHRLDPELGHGGHAPVRSRVRKAFSTASGLRRYSGTGGSGAVPASSASAATVAGPAGEGVSTGSTGRSK